MRTRVIEAETMARVAVSIEVYRNLETRYDPSSAWRGLAALHRRENNEPRISRIDKHRQFRSSIGYSSTLLASPLYFPVISPPFHASNYLSTVQANGIPLDCIVPEDVSMFFRPRIRVSRDDSNPLLLARGLLGI